MDTAALAEAMIDAGVRARVVGIDREQLDEAFLGRAFDRALLDELPASCDPCGENGEFHSFASGGPAFRRPLRVTLGRVRRSADGRFVHAEPRLAR